MLWSALCICHEQARAKRLLRGLSHAFGELFEIRALVMKNNGSRSY